MSQRIPAYSITTSGGSGNVVLNNFLGRLCINVEGINIVPASGSPTGNYYVQDPVGGYSDAGSFSGTKVAMGRRVYILNSTFYLTNVSPDATFTIHIYITEQV